jgi:hypothetical protein
MNYYDENTQPLVGVILAYRGKFFPAVSSEWTHVVFHYTDTRQKACNKIYRRLRGRLSLLQIRSLYSRSSPL